MYTIWKKVYTCVCIYTYIYIYTHTHKHTCNYACIHTKAYTHSSNKQTNTPTYRPAACSAPSKGLRPPQRRNGWRYGWWRHPRAANHRQDSQGSGRSQALRTCCGFVFLPLKTWIFEILCEALAWIEAMYPWWGHGHGDSHGHGHGHRHRHRHRHRHLYHHRPWRSSSTVLSHVSSLCCLLIHLYGFVSLSTQLLLIIFIYWSSPLLFNKLIIPVTVTVITATVTVTGYLLWQRSGYRWTQRTREQKQKGSYSLWHNTRTQTQHTHGCVAKINIPWPWPWPWRAHRHNTRAHRHNTRAHRHNTRAHRHNTRSTLTRFVICTWSRWQSRNIYFSNVSQSESVGSGPEGLEAVWLIPEAGTFVTCC